MRPRSSRSNIAALRLAHSQEPGRSCCACSWECVERSIQAQFLIPPAVSIGVGVLLGTALLMLLTPAPAMAEEEASARLRRVLAGGRRVAAR
jgi:hypothetical protein